MIRRSKGGEEFEALVSNLEVEGTKEVGHWIIEEEKEALLWSEERFVENRIPNIDFNRMLCATLYGTPMILPDLQKNKTNNKYPQCLELLYFYWKLVRGLSPTSGYMWISGS